MNFALRKTALNFSVSLTSIGLSVLMASSAQADTILGIYAGAGQINYDMSGDFQDLNDNGSVIDLEDDLNLEGDTGNYYYIAIEHFVPLIPNLKVARSEIEESARSTLSRSVRFQGQLFPAATQVATQIDFSHTDFTLYYEILDNWVNLDLGLTGRQLDGELTMVGQGLVSAQEELDEFVPLLYGKARFDLPLTGLYVEATADWINVGGVNITDFWGKLGYTFAFGLGLELGIREIAIELDDIEDLDASIDLSGTYMAATFHF